VVGYKGRIIFDITKPDGTPRKLLNVDLIKNLGWKAQTKLIDGLNLSYHDYLLRNIT
jgi:GDP-L-fucose synthase